ncbi:MAG: hypothetical protein EOP89_15555, partial [Lysobacteraceae bacterium]
RTAAAQTPPMGWNPWNAFHADVDEAKVRAVAKAMVDSGLAARGYHFVNIDDGWALRRLVDERLRIRNNTFPSSATPGSDTGSFKPFTDYIHGLGLKAGIYTDIGRRDDGLCRCLRGDQKRRQADPSAYGVLPSICTDHVSFLPERLAGSERASAIALLRFANSNAFPVSNALKRNYHIITLSWVMRVELDTLYALRDQL